MRNILNKNQYLIGNELQIALQESRIPSGITNKIGVYLIKTKHIEC